MLLQKLRYLVTPTRDWGPALPKHRKLIDYVDGWVVNPVEEKNANKYRPKSSKTDLQVSVLYKWVSPSETCLRSYASVKSDQDRPCVLTKSFDTIDRMMHHENMPI